MQTLKIPRRTGFFSVFTAPTARGARAALAALAALAIGLTTAAMAHETDSPAGLKKPVIKNLMTNMLQGAPGMEVILSHVALPPNVTLPKHWHPGEEFAFILQGSVTLIMEGHEDRVVSQGEAGVVPLKKVHTARSGSEGATILVFRVHEQGKPGRILVKP